MLALMRLRGDKLDRPRPREGPRLAGAGVNRGRSAKPGQRAPPKVIQRRFMSHAMLESDSIPAGKDYVSAYARRRG